MRREDKYPTTDTFLYHNENPQNRFTGDCTYRAISRVTGKPWKEVVMEMAELACENGYSPSSKENIDRYLQKNGWTKHKQPRKANGKKYTGREFCKWLNKNCAAGAVVANIGAHHVTCIMRGGKFNPDFKVNDIWDCTDDCIGNYWTMIDLSSGE